MKRLITLSILLACAFSALAQTRSAVPERFSCKFKMTDEAGKLVASGEAFVQGDCYRLETDNLKVWCNGSDRWIYTPVSDELVIQDNDVSFLKQISVSITPAGKAKVAYQNYSIEIENLVERAEPWSATDFIIDPDTFGIDTIITDLRR